MGPTCSSVDTKTSSSSHALSCIYVSLADFLSYQSAEIKGKEAEEEAEEDLIVFIMNAYRELRFAHNKSLLYSSGGVVFSLENVYIHPGSLLCRLAVNRPDAFVEVKRDSKTVVTREQQQARLADIASLALALAELADTLEHTNVAKYLRETLGVCDAQLPRGAPIPTLTAEQVVTSLGQVDFHSLG